MSARRPSRKPKPNQVRGERNASAKLTARQVRFARRAVRERQATIAGLARMYGVSKPTMWDVIRGYSWRHIQ